jgi:hypothetical protein
MTMARLVQIAAMVAVAGAASGCGGTTKGIPADSGDGDRAVTCFDGSQGIPPHYIVTAAQACQVLNHVHGDGSGAIFYGPGCNIYCSGYTACNLEPSFIQAVTTLNPG